ncbi:MAG: TlpA family protein disulfide reductase [Burkholderiaceae bacterium]
MPSTSTPELALAPELSVSQWLNSAQPITLAGLRGRVVLIHAFQMLCPGCVMHGIPQTRRIAQLLQRDDFVVLGLHSVFVHEFRLEFPIGIDRHEPGSSLPMTMRAYGLQGTPTTLLIDRAGTLRMHEFGAVDDLALGVRIGELLAQA